MVVFLVFGTSLHVPGKMMQENLTCGTIQIMPVRTLAGDTVSADRLIVRRVSVDSIL